MTGCPVPPPKATRLPRSGPVPPTLQSTVPRSVPLTLQRPLLKALFHLHYSVHCSAFRPIYVPELIVSLTQLMEKVGKALSKRVIPPQDSEQKQQALFYLLGPDYTERYFPTSTYSVDLLVST